MSKFKGKMKKVQDAKNYGMVHWGDKNGSVWTRLEGEEKVEDIDDLLIEEEVEVLGRTRTSKNQVNYEEVDDSCEVELSDDSWDFEKSSKDPNFIDDDSDDWKEMVEGTKKIKGNSKFRGKGRRLGGRGKGKIDKKNSRLLTNAQIKSILEAGE